MTLAFRGKLNHHFGSKGAAAQAYCLRGGSFYYNGSRSPAAAGGQNQKEE